MLTTSNRLAKHMQATLHRLGATHAGRRVFAAAAALQILAMPLGMAAVCALSHGQIQWLHKYGVT